NFTSLLSKRRKYASGVKTGRWLFTKHHLPRNITWGKLTYRCVPSVVAATACPRPKAAVCEVEAVPALASHAVVLTPLDKLCFYPALQHEIFNQRAYRVVDKCSDHGGTLTKCPPHRARDVVLAATFPYIETPRGVNSP